MSYRKDKLISAQKIQVQPRARPAKGMVLLVPVLLSFMSSQHPPHAVLRNHSSLSP